MWKWLWKYYKFCRWWKLCVNFFRKIFWFFDNICKLLFSLFSPCNYQFWRPPTLLSYLNYKLSTSLFCKTKFLNQKTLLLKTTIIFLTNLLSTYYAIFFEKNYCYTHTNYLHSLFNISTTSHGCSHILTKCGNRRTTPSDGRPKWSMTRPAPVSSNSSNPSTSSAGIDASKLHQSKV